MGTEKNVLASPISWRPSWPGWREGDCGTTAAPMKISIIIRRLKECAEPQRNDDDVLVIVGAIIITSKTTLQALFFSITWSRKRCFWSRSHCSCAAGAAGGSVVTVVVGYRQRHGNRRISGIMHNQCWCRWHGRTFGITFSSTVVVAHANLIVDLFFGTSDDLPNSIADFGGLFG